MHCAEDTRPPLPALKNWCVGEALPYWGDIGFDRRSGSFHEKLDLDGTPVTDVPRRTFVQARQIYVFAHAAKLGWFPEGARIAHIAAKGMIKRHWAPDGRPGWVFSLWPDGGIADATRYAYTQAFALFGLAWAFDLSRDPRLRDMADLTTGFLDDHLASSGSHGFCSSDADATLLQNPHMHLFEAFLCWHALTGDDHYLTRARRLYRLFELRLFDALSSTVPERPDNGQGRTIFEPGHSFEWVWLLRAYSKLSGEDVDNHAGALFEKALSYGLVRDVVINETAPDGLIIDAGARIWPQTEALKAFVAESEAGRPGMAAESARLAEILQGRFLGGRFAAGWLDRLNADGKLEIDFVPASAFYHIFLATAEIDRVFLRGA